MLKCRVIPTLLWKNVGLVKGVGFNSWRRVGTILPAVKVYNARQVDEIIIADVTASLSGSEPDFDMLRDIAHESFVPLTFGGGIKTLDHIRTALQLGADKISINSAALDSPDLISAASNKFGSQCVVLSIDAKLGEDGIYYCYKNSGTTATTQRVVEWAVKAELYGAGEILLTDIVLDGSMKGYNFDLIKRVTDSVKIPVIVSGGAGTLDDFYQAITCYGASAVAAASIFHFTQTTPLEIKTYLKSKGVLVRNVNINYK